MSFKAKKSFGQNFLQDDQYIEKMVSLIALKPEQHCIEIGPGLGALTDYLIERCERLDLVELDPRIIEALNKKYISHANYNIHHQDVLQFAIETLEPKNKVRVVGNLPYNISTPILFHMLAQQESIEDMHFMLQREVVLRMGAEPGSKQYGRLSVMIQALCDMSYFFDIPPEAFNPAPKVDSSFFRLKPNNRFQLSPEQIQQLSQCINQAFQQRRKTIRKIFGARIDQIELESMNISAKDRPEQISVEAFVKLSQAL